MTGEDFQDLDKVEALYDRAFPPNERSPLEEILSEKSGMLRVLAFYQGPVFCGMAVTLSTEKLVHIIYFAIEEALRGQGLGSIVLNEMQKQASGKKIIVDVERVESGAGNNDQRAKRIAFYMKNGYQETPVRYRWHGDDYVILSAGGIMTEEEWSDFWKEVYAKTGRDW